MRKNPLNHNKIFVTLISVFILINSTNANHIVNEDINIKNTNISNYLGSDANVLKELRKQYIVVKTDKKLKPMEFIVTAYDLSYQSTQKSRGTKGYGITSSGFDLRGHTLRSARTIATDPSIIPTHSKVRLIFKDENYKQFDGIYISRDVGGKIIGLHIDLFVGDFKNRKPSKLATQFGNTECEVEIIKE